MKSSPDHAFAAALLAGGMSRRMGRDKAWLDWQGRPLWQVQLEKLRALAPRQLILSCRAGQGLSPTDVEILFDPVEDQGPLPALQRCLQATPLPLLVLAVDLPQMDAGFLSSMVEMAASSSKGLIYHHERGYEPLCAIYPPSVLPLLGSHRRLQTFAQEAVDAGLLKKHCLTAGQKTYFLNINTPADLPCLPPSPFPSPG